MCPTDGLDPNTLIGWFYCFSFCSRVMTQSLYLHGLQRRTDPFNRRLQQELWQIFRQTSMSFHQLYQIECAVSNWVSDVKPNNTKGINSLQNNNNRTVTSLFSMKIVLTNNFIEHESRLHCINTSKYDQSVQYSNLV